MPAQQNSQQNNTFNDSGSLGIQGYTSPYASTTSSVPQSSPQSSNTVAPNNSAQNQTPSIQDFLVNPQAPQIQNTNNANSDNILDRSEHFDEIIKNGTLHVNTQIQPAPTQQTNIEPIKIPEPIQTQQIEAIVQKQENIVASPQKQNTPSQINPALIHSAPQIQENNTNVSIETPPTVSNIVQGNNNTEINPEKDLQKREAEKTYTKIADLLDLAIERNASDLHLTTGYSANLRIDDKLVPVGSVLSKDEVKELVLQSLTQNQRELLEVNREVDLSYQHEQKGRFRINAYFEKGNLAAAFRLIPNKIKSITDLGLPGMLLDISRLSQGLFLVTGPTGSGKSTTLAALIQHINETSPKHIITIEDPIEYIYPKGVALIDQRELGNDTHDWTIAMKSALRQDPDVILIGELRDFETIQLAITLAETGHLVFTTLHTSSAAQSIDRIIDVFPPHQQQQVKTQLAGCLRGILSQRLVPLIGGGRIAVVELLMVTPAVQNLIREGKTYQIDNVIATSADMGMISLEKSLVKLVRQGKISTVTAQEYAIRPDEILKLLKSAQL